MFCQAYDCVEGRCQARPSPGAACDDGDPCTVDDVCDAAGACGGAPACDDGTACTEERCVPGPVCADGEAPLDGRCLDARFSWQLRTAEAATAGCVARGGTLAVVRDAAANAALRAKADAVCGPGEPVLLGLGGPGLDGLAWPDGAAAIYSNWAADQPAALAPGEPIFVVMDADGAWRTSYGLTRCVACVDAAPQPVACLARPADPAAAGVPEVCNGSDDDCDGEVDEALDAGALCDDGDPCTADVCAGAQGCQAAADPLRCDDGNPCTTDTCDPELGCANTPDDAACDDGIECTTDRCDPRLGCVSEANDAACDDGQVCTTDVCQPGIGCAYEADPAACDDGIACTDDVCRPFEGCVPVPVNARCDDGDPCTDDVCVAGAGCAPVFNEAPCDDGDVCTAVDRCREGACVGVAPLRCDDGLACTADACDPALGCVAPLVGDCADPGPAAGYYAGLLRTVGRSGNLVFDCENAISVVVDASRAPDAQGFGTGRCVLTGLPVPFSFTAPAVFEGAIDGDGLVGTVRLNELRLDWAPALVRDADGVPQRIEGRSAGIAEGRFFNPLVPPNEALPYETSGRLERVAVRGTCCRPDGRCLPSLDFECFGTGGAFQAQDAGQCCDAEGSCALRTAAECATLGQTFVASRAGSCCLPEGGCEDLQAEVCALAGGVHTRGLSCEDGDDDGLPDACGAPEDFGRDVLPACALDGDRLTVDVGGVITLALVGPWIPEPGGYQALGAVQLETPAGPIELPDAAPLRVSCGPRFNLEGSLGGLPLFGNVGVFSSLVADTEAARVALGFRFGHELRAEGLDLGAPVADGRPYLYAAFEQAGVGVSLGPDARLDAAEGTEVFAAVDPTDPAFVLTATGDGLLRPSGNLVGGVGFGLSRGGNLRWRSARDLPGRDAPGERQLSGHVFQAGEFGLIPLPGIRANLFLEGEVVWDLAAHARALEAAGQALLSGDTAALAAELGRPGSEILAETRLGINANTLQVAVGPLEFDIGEASAFWDGRRLEFSGAAFTPGARLAEGEADPLFAAFAALTLQQIYGVDGWVDDVGFRVEVRSDLVAGPFALRGATLVLDSQTGIELLTGEFQLDFGGFLRQLQELLDCDFDAEGAVCRLGDQEIGRISGALDADGFRLEAGLAVPLLGAIDFAARVAADGSFVLTGSVEGGLPGAQTAAATVTLTSDSVTASARWQQFNSDIQLSGTIGWDGSYRFQGTGRLTLLGFPMSQVDVILDHREGLVAMGLLEPLPQLVSPRTRVEATLRVGPDPLRWVLSGRGTVEAFGHRLTEVTVDASSADARLRLSGRTTIGGARADLRGEVAADFFRLEGSGDLSVGVNQLAGARFVLDSDGLAVSGRLSLLNATFTLQGRVQPNGDFELVSQVNQDLSVAGRTINASATLYNRGGRLGLEGSGSLRFAGQRFVGEFYAFPGSFGFSASLAASGRAGPLSAEGRVSVFAGTLGFGATFRGQGCTDTPVGPACVEASVTVDSNGVICLAFPVGVGFNCVDVL